ncbi:MAG: class I SAM-dependent methyltransferase [Gemmatimonadota bacterium]|nr:class I SAM-dependent methyltransferase [Gemmatimonadota bacterium]MDE2983461.1 class I SAM-dependent methyltransferase [Gemmatimonadota bacterium]
MKKTTAPWTGRRAGGGSGIAQMAARLRNALVKIARNPVTAWRMLWPRYGPFAAKAPDTEFRRAIRWSFGDLGREPLNAVFPGIEHIDVRVVRCYDREPLLSMTPSEVLAIGAMVRFLRPERILEIGTFEGNTTVNLAANAPASARVFTLDLPPDWARRYALDVPDIHYNAATGNHTGRQFIETPHADRITQLWGDSAAFEWDEHGPFDFILIDGCHTYEYAVSDTLNALRVIRPGGAIVWHDYGMLEDVSRAVDECARGIKARAIQGTRLAVGFP